MIGQRELRNDNAEIMRRVEAGESFTVTRNGRPVAELIPHQADRAVRRRTVGELQAEFRRMTPVDSARWHRERAAPWPPRSAGLVATRAPGGWM